MSGRVKRGLSAGFDAGMQQIFTFLLKMLKRSTGATEAYRPSGRRATSERLCASCGSQFIARTEDRAAKPG